MSSVIRRSSTGAMVLALALAAGTASAEVYDGTGEVEIYAGWLWPDDEAGESLSDLTYGFRAGYNPLPHFGISGTLLSRLRISIPFTTSTMTTLVTCVCPCQSTITCTKYLPISRTS